jgi:Trk K+ transport system NAD-binding subunit
MNTEKQKILLIGLGHFGRALLKTLSTDWSVVVVDMDETRTAPYLKEFQDVTYIRGAGDSLLTWEKLNLEEIKYIISALNDVDVDQEVCHIAREVYKLKIPIIVLVYEDVDEKRFEKYQVSLINPRELGIRVVLQRMQKNVIPAVNVGLGKGELLEVTIKARSHLVGRKLKHLCPSRWHISALYRDGKLILPDGNSSMRIGDRVLLVGDPKVLESVTTTLLKGLPQFPLQYGTDIVFPLHVDFSAHMDEAIYWLNSFNAQRIQFLPFRKKLSHTFTDKIKTDVKNFTTGPTIDLFKEIFTRPVNTGVIVVPTDKSRLNRYRLRETFTRSRKPFLLSRLGCPYKGVVISLNGPDPVKALETGLEMAGMLEVPFRVVYVTMPKEMRGRKEDNCLRLRQQVVQDFEGIHKTSIDYKVLEGNPVQETLKYLENLEKYLLVTVTDPNASLSIFKPNAPYHVARKTSLSTLVLPEVYTNE